MPATLEALLPAFPVYNFEAPYQELYAPIRRFTTGRETTLIMNDPVLEELLYETPLVPQDILLNKQMIPPAVEARVRENAHTIATLLSINPNNGSGVKYEERGTALRYVMYSPDAPLTGPDSLVLHHKDFTYHLDEDVIEYDAVFGLHFMLAGGAELTARAAKIIYEKRYKFEVQEPDRQISPLSRGMMTLFVRHGTMSNPSTGHLFRTTSAGGRIFDTVSLMPSRQEGQP